MTGKIPLVEKPVLDWLIDGNDERPPEPALSVRSASFRYLDGSRTPGIDDAKAIEARHAALVALRSARYLAVASGDVTDGRSEQMFEGGEVEATVAIGEITAGQFVCAVRFTSQPAVILWLHPPRAADRRSAERQATRDAVADAFRDEASKQLSIVAPGATLVQVLPTYSPGAAQSEWGIGWRVDLAIRRFAWATSTWQATSS